MLGDESHDLRSRFEEALRREPEAQETLELALATLEVSGQCRVETPWAELRPVLTRDGMRWCCTHATEHCSNAPESLR